MTKDKPKGPGYYTVEETAFLLFGVPMWILLTAAMVMYVHSSVMWGYMGLLNT